MFRSPIPIDVRSTQAGHTALDAAQEDGKVAALLARLITVHAAEAAALSLCGVAAASPEVAEMRRAGSLARLLELLKRLDQLAADGTVAPTLVEKVRDALKQAARQTTGVVPPGVVLPHCGL